jgi:hypothetical protein
VKYFLLIISVWILLAGCNKETDCLDFSSNTGLIVREVNMGECYSVMIDESYIIKDSISYVQLPSSTYESIQEDLGCSDNPPRPTINFNSYDLVGAKTFAKGCIVTYSRDISFDSITNTLSYVIDVHQCGNCGKERYNMNWVLIPKRDTVENLIVDINYYIETN